MRFQKTHHNIAMAKRKNSSPRSKKIDASDDQTIIKINPSQKSRKAKTGPKQEISSKTEKKSSSRSSTKTRASSSRKPTKSTSSRKSTVERTVTTKNTEQTGSKTSTNTPPPPTVSATTPDSVKISQSVAILIDGNNIEMSLTQLTNNKSAVLNFDTVIPKLLNGRGLNRLIYFREGVSISQKLADRLHTHYFGSVVPCHKSADIPLSIQATQLAEKVDTIIILSGDSDYVELVRHVKSKGVRVEIAAIEITTAAILKEEADYYSPITKEDAFIMK